MRTTELLCLVYGDVHPSSVYRLYRRLDRFGTAVGMDSGSGHYRRDWTLGHARWFEATQLLQGFNGADRREPTDSSNKARLERAIRQAMPAFHHPSGWLVVQPHRSWVVAEPELILPDLVRCTRVLNIAKLAGGVEHAAAAPLPA
jgi:hypothetical protein